MVPQSSFRFQVCAFWAVGGYCDCHSLGISPIESESLLPLLLIRGCPVSAPTSEYVRSNVMADLGLGKLAASTLVCWSSELPENKSSSSVGKDHMERPWDSMERGRDSAEPSSTDLSIKTPNT